MNCPQSNPFLAVIPLMHLAEARPIRSMDPSRYSLFLQGRLSEQEFVAECSNMRAVMLNNPLLQRQAAQLEAFIGRMGGKGCTGECCLTITAAMFCCGFPMLCLAMNAQTVTREFRAEWLRVMQGECSRLSAAYGARGLRFDLGEETRVTGYVGRHHSPVTASSAWIAITIAPMMMQMPMGGAMQPQMAMPMQTGFPQQPMPMQMQAGATPAMGQPVMQQPMLQQPLLPAGGAAPMAYAAPPQYGAMAYYAPAGQPAPPLYGSDNANPPPGPPPAATFEEPRKPQP